MSIKHDMYLLTFTLILQNGEPLKKYDFWKDVNHSFGENYIPTQFASKFRYMHLSEIFLYIDFF